MSSRLPHGRCAMSYLESNDSNAWPLWIKVNPRVTSKASYLTWTFKSKSHQLFAARSKTFHPLCTMTHSFKPPALKKWAFSFLAVLGKSILEKLKSWLFDKSNEGPLQGGSYPEKVSNRLWPISTLPPHLANRKEGRHIPRESCRAQEDYVMLGKMNCISLETWVRLDKDYGLTLWAWPKSWPPCKFRNEDSDQYMADTSDISCESSELRAPTPFEASLRRKLQSSNSLLQKGSKCCSQLLRSTKGVSTLKHTSLRLVSLPG